MAKQEVTLVPPKGSKHTEPWTTTSAVEAVNLRARGWRDQQTPPEGPEDAAAYDPGDHTVDEVLEHLGASDDAERERVLEAERAGKGRKSILSADSNA